MNPDMTISDREAQDQELYELGKENFEFRERIRELEAQLEAVRELQRYTIIGGVYTDNPHGKWIRAAELDAALYNQKR